MSIKPNQSIGVGLRPDHYEVFEIAKPEIVDFVEVISENLLPWKNFKTDRSRRRLISLRDEYDFSLHGVSLNIGSVDPLSLPYLQNLKNLITEYDPIRVSDHLCFTGVGGKNTHDLLPLPYTQSMIEHLVPRIEKVQEFLGRQLMLENVSSYILWQESEMSESVFLREVSKRSGCSILLDVNNIYVSSKNHGLNSLDYLRDMEGMAIAQYHLAGHDDHGEIIIDTHGASVQEPVWALYEKTLQLLGKRPVLLERDAAIPEWPMLETELKRMKAYA